MLYLYMLVDKSYPKLKYYNVGVYQTAHCIEILNNTNLNKDFCLLKITGNLNI